jgi:hypothetical protein
LWSFGTFFPFWCLDHVKSGNPACEQLGMKGPMLRFQKQFRRKNCRQKIAVFTQNMVKLDPNIGFHERRQFFSPKIAEK